MKLSSLIISINTVLVFCLGVFGNKIAEVINLKIEIIIGLIIVLILVNIYISIKLTNSNSTQSKTLSIKNFLLDRMTTAFPFGVLTGIIISYVSSQLIHLMDIDSHFILGNAVSQYGGSGEFLRYKVGCALSIDYYEILSFLISGGVIYYLFRIKNNHSIIYAFSLGCAIGVSILVIKYSNHEVFTTLIGTITMFFLLLGIIISSSDLIGKLIRFLTEKK